MNSGNISRGRKYGQSFIKSNSRKHNRDDEDEFDASSFPPNKEQRNATDSSFYEDEQAEARFDADKEDFEDESTHMISELFRGKTVDKISSEPLQLQNPTFDMKVCSYHFSDKLQNYWDSKVKDETTCYLYEGSTTSINSFARGFSNLCDDKGIAVAHQKDILNLMFNAFGNKINLPVTVLNKPVKVIPKHNHNKDDSEEDDDDCNSKSSFNTQELNIPNVTVDLKRFNTERPRCFGFDQCVNDCYVYVGTENAEKFSCPECGVRRFQPCSRSACEGLGTSTCSHLLSCDGVSQKKLWYRPILMLIMDLVKTPHFLTALNYQRKQLVGDEDLYSDFLDGELPQRHLKEMREKFKTYSFSKSTSSAYGSTIKSVIILFSEFYDGGQLFKRKYCDFWPLFVSIMNLPPVYRGKIGIGLFLVALYSGKHINAEKFLFSDCFCEELRMLYDGVERTIEGQTYFIQARLIFHVLDTKAAEAILDIQSWTTSRNGCALCQLITGTHNSTKTTFGGHRHLLGPNNYLRFIGQSGKCCPENFYSPETIDPWYSETSFISDTKPITLEERLLLEKKPSNRRAMCTPCGKNSMSQEVDDILKFFNSSSQTFDWNHKGLYNFNDFVMKESGKPNQPLKSLKSFLFYRHFDLRPYRQYSRISSEQHLIYAQSARDMNLNWKKGPKKHVKGFQDVWVYNKLQNHGIECIDWPIVHAMNGVETNLNKMLFGESKVNDGGKSSKQKDAKKDDVNDDGGKSNTKKEKAKKEKIEKVCPPFRPVERPWEASGEDKKRCRAWLCCILLPPGGDDTWNLRSFISKDGSMANLKMNQKLKLYTCFLRVILHNFKTIPLAFHWFYLMFTDDMKRLQQSKILKEDVVQLSNDIIETVCIAEGIFPSSLITAQMHQLIHMAPMIYKIGPPMGVSEFAGERALGVVKRRKTDGHTGGRSFDKRICVSQVEKEVRVLREFYKEAVSAKPLDLNNERVFNLDENGVLHYTDRPFGMGKKECSQKRLRKENITLTDHELEYFLEALLEELKKYDDKELQSSTLHQLHDVYLSGDHKTSVSFHIWLKEFAESKILVEEDSFHVLANQIVKMNISFYKNAYIYGVKLRARGSNLRERTESIRNDGKYKRENTDMSSWQMKYQYSSWCKFSQKKTNLKVDKEDKYYYGLVNAFFQIKLNDSILDKTMLASVNAMTFTTTSAPFCLEFVEVGAFVRKPMFVVVSDILPTAIATIPLDTLEKPIPLPKANISEAERKEPNSYFSQYQISEHPHIKLKKFGMIILHPEKLSLKPKNTAFKQFLFCK